MFRLFLFILGFGLLGVSILNRIPSGDVVLSDGPHRFLSRFMPQRWALFTQDPKVERLTFYRIDGNKTQKIDFRPFQAQYFFGLNKSARQRWYALSEAAKMVPDKKSKYGNLSFSPQNLEANFAIEAIPLQLNKDLFPECTEMLILKQRPVAPAHDSNPYAVQVLSKISNVRINCDG